MRWPACLPLLVTVSLMVPTKATQDQPSPSNHERAVLVLLILKSPTLDQVKQAEHGKLSCARREYWERVNGLGTILFEV
ncbi:hypothetical protein BJX65DRAFT_186162 [Aspergillus insuetus]